MARIMLGLIFVVGVTANSVCFGQYDLLKSLSNENFKKSDFSGPLGAPRPPEVATVKSLDQLKSALKRFEQLRQVDKIYGKFLIVKNEQMQRFVELTTPQLETLQTSSETVRESESAITRMLIDRRSVARKVYGSDSDLEKQLQAEFKDKRTDIYRKYDEIYEKTLTFDQRDMAQRFMAKLRMRTFAPGRYEIFRPVLLAEILKLTNEQREQVMQTTMNTWSELDRKIHEEMNDCYQLILADVPGSKREFILEILNTNVGFVRSYWFPSKLEKLESHGKSFAAIYDKEMLGIKVTLLRDKTLRKEIELTEKQVDSLRDAMDSIMQTTGSDLNAIVAELKIAHQQTYKITDEKTNMGRELSEISMKCLKEIAEAIDDELLPFQRDQLSKICTLRLLHRNLWDEHTLGWPYMLATTQGLTDKQLKQVLSNTEKTKAKFDKRVEKLTAAANKKVIESYPDDKREDLKNLLKLEIGFN